MDKSMILELTKGGNCYTDKILMTENAEYNKCSDEVHEMLVELCKNMTEEEKRKTIWKFELAQGGLEATTADEYFKEGFKLGMILAAQNLLE